MENLNFTNNSTGAIVVEEKQMPIVNVDQAIAEWEAYQKVTELILDESDYQDIKGRKFKKKSAWRKYARAFNISTEILEKEILKTDKEVVKEATFVIRATLPTGRYADGWGNCSRREGNKAHPNHDIPATAMTRATNRAIADLIGAGEVSAEEIQAEQRVQARQNAKEKLQKKPEPKPETKMRPGHMVEPIKIIDTEVVEDDPLPFESAKDIATSIVAELPPNNTNLLFAKMELKKLIDKRVVSEEESKQILKELEGMF